MFRARKFFCVFPVFAANRSMYIDEKSGDQGKFYTRCRKSLHSRLQTIEQLERQCKGPAALLDGDCSVANARQGATLPALGASHSPPINTADRFAPLTLTLKLL